MWQSPSHHYEGNTMQLNQRGKRVRAAVIYLAILIGLIAVTSAMGIWDIPESCLVEQVGCPAGYEG